MPVHLAALQRRLVVLVDELGAGETTPDVGRAIVAAVGKLIDLAQFAVDLDQQAEVLERIAALEAQLAAPPARRYGR